MKTATKAASRRRATTKRSSRRRGRKAKAWFSRRGKLAGLVAAGLCLIGAMHATHTAAANANQTTVQNDTQGTSEVTVVEKSFAATGATPDSALVHDYSVMNQTYMMPQTLSEIGRRMQQELSLRQAKIVTRNEDGERLWEVCGVLHGHTVVTVVLSSFRATQQQPAFSVLTVSEQIPSTDLNRLSWDMLALDDGLKRFALTPQISTCISGFVGARLRDVPPKTLVDLAFSAVRAREVEGVSSGLVTSISGYSLETPWHIQTAGGDMNLQVGVHYDSVAHATRVVVGSPMIVTTY